ncbi:DUF1446 domain-containing protein [Rhodobacteraceae bacterium M382]|nr:DUF1446 domain-containing protein [Rhodobacteraceae bacterium M382]
MTKALRIGGACGFWGETAMATPQLLAGDGVDVLVYDYLAEITMSILARARQKNPERGYATDFVGGVLADSLDEIAKQGVRVLSNAGGVNPKACARAVQALIKDKGLSLKVAVVEGDDLMGRSAEFADKTEMFSGAPMPGADRILSMNAYLGAWPIVAALNAGADIVITGRCVDSALTLAACIHRFGWESDAYDQLAAGSLAGHLLECGPQSTGGNFTDWQLAGDLAGIGYPVVEIQGCGDMTVTKPAGTQGIVSPAAVCEQMLYEIGDPQAYVLPDVICDFSQVVLEQVGSERVAVRGAKGRAPTGQVKVSVTWLDGYRAGYLFQFNGVNARRKAQNFARIGLDRAQKALRKMGGGDYSDVSIETFGGRPGDGPYEEIALKAAVRHQDPRAVGLFLKELIGAALATPPGLHGFTGAGRPKPSPVVALFSFLVDSEILDQRIEIEGRMERPAHRAHGPSTDTSMDRCVPHDVDGQAGPTVTCRLEELAWARSGDKGDKANIGVIARHPDYMPWIWKSLTPHVVTRRFKGEIKGPVERFYLPGSVSMNILLHEALGGGGVSSLRNDSQAKSFAQVLLDLPVNIPEHLLHCKPG